MATYEELTSKTYKIDEDGERSMLANFTARIIDEIRTLDGNTIDTVLRIEGAQADEQGDPAPLPVATVTANAFPAMAWVMQAWGVRAVIQPGAGVKEDLRTAIQMISRPKVQTIYKKTGWQDIGGCQCYLHHGGAISEKGNDPSVTISLPSELTKYNLASKAKVTDAIAATLALQYLSVPEVMWPLLAATFAPLFGPVDYGIHVTGRTGTYKSELVSLIQSHYGAELDARHLPASWSSTANALEALAYYAANAVMTIDDFVPSGTSWQVRNYHTTADKIIRSQGNQAGRSRLTDTSNLQQTMYPRGLILSTGEDTPEGHSVRARLLIMELSPGDIDVANLTKAQANRAFYPATTAALIQDIAKNKPNLAPRAAELRTAHLSIGHARTPTTIGSLIATIEYVLRWAQRVGVLTKQRAEDSIVEATHAIVAAGSRQNYYLEAADPCDMLLATLRHVFAAGLAHVRTTNGGIPRSPTILGWTQEGHNDDMPTFKSHGPCIGWCSWDTDELFLDANIGYNVLKKIAGADMSTTKQTMFKRMKDAGLLTRTDDIRSRNTVRITAEGHARQCLCMPISQALDQQETPQDEPEADAVPLAPQVEAKGKRKK